MSLDRYPLGGDDPVTWGRGKRRPSMRPSSRAQTRGALVVVAVAVGFLVGLQAREVGSPEGRLAAERPEDLARLLAGLNAEADELARQISTLRLRVARYQSSSQQEELALEDARKALADLRVLAGVVPARGPGVSLTVSPSQEDLPWELMLDLVQELRDAGAEALALNGHRVVASTWFGPAEEGLSVDGRTVRPPYRITAIGPAAGIREALDIPGGPVAVIRAQPGVTVEMEEERRLEVPPLRREIRFEYARPAP